MAAKKKAAKRGAKKAVRKPAAKWGASRRPRPSPARKGKPAAPRPAAAAKARAGQATAKSRKVEPRTTLPPTPRPITAGTLALVLIEPLKAEATAAFERGETVELFAGLSEEGAPVETLVFSSGDAVQSSGAYVHRGTWSGARLVTDKGHLLDPDGNCFCRDCEAAKGYTLDDDE